MTILFVSCSNSKFSGTNQEKTTPSIQPTATDSDQTAQSPTPTSTDAAKINVTEDCATDKGVTDSNATFTFSNLNEVRDFVNSLQKYTFISDVWAYQCAMKNDPVTANKICNLKGYKESSQIQEGSFYSCRDNCIALWDESIKNFSIINSCDYNNRIDHLECRGKLADECANDPSWIFKK